MSRRKARKSKAPRFLAPAAGKTSSAPAKRRSRLGWGLLVLAAVAGTVGGWVWFKPGRAPAAPPEIDFGRVDASAARTLRSHLETVRVQPRSGEAWGWLGALLRIYEFPAEARQCLKEAEHWDPRNPRWPYFQSLLLETESPWEALRKARRAAELSGQDPPNPRFRLATLLAEAGQWSEARRELEALTRTHPGFGPALLLLAHEAQVRAAWPEAIELATRAADDARCPRGAWSLLAMLHQRNGNAEAAVEASRRAALLPADPNLPDPFESEAAQRRGDALDTSAVCHSLLAAGQLDQASELIGRLRRDHANRAETWLLQGRLQILRQDFPGAEQSLRHHLQLDPQSTQGLFQLGLALMSQERFLEAAQIFAQATELKRDFGPAYYNQAFSLARAGRPREAVVPFRQCLKHNPEHLPAYLLLADLLFTLGEKEEAQDLLARAETLSPGDPRIASLRTRAASPSQQPR